MTSESNLVADSVDIIRKRGEDALKKARAEILESSYDGGLVSSAVKYFARVTLREALPVFPALTSLSCEAEGGKPERTTGVSAALSLIASAADIHDDVIDKSARKYNKKTVYGKFGADIALLAGDALLIQGLTLLYRECSHLSQKQKRKILILLNKAFLDVSKAEAKETVMKGKLDIPPEKYLEILRLKCVVPQVHCQIGAVIADANNEAISKMGEFGKTYGIISSIVEEFADLFSTDEMGSRIKNECPPLPLLYALKNPRARREVLKLVSSANMRAADLRRVAKIAMRSKEVQDICDRMNLDSQEAIKKLPLIDDKIRKDLASLILAPIISLRQSIDRNYC
jgi:geranylgeranyl pyrophosphate synthase